MGMVSSKLYIRLVLLNLESSIEYNITFPLTGATFDTQLCFSSKSKSVSLNRAPSINCTLNQENKIAIRRSASANKAATEARAKTQFDISPN